MLNEVKYPPPHPVLALPKRPSPFAEKDFALQQGVVTSH